MAQFIGENNTLNGTISDLKNDVATVKLDSGDIIDCKPVNVSTIGERTQVSIRPERVELNNKRLPPGSHTLTAEVLEFIYMGDVFRTTSYPIIDKFNGGSLRGTIAALDRAVDLVGPDTKIIPGHGLEIEDRDRLIEFREMILEIQGRVYDMIREGMHLDEIMAAQPTASYDSTWENDPGWTYIDFVPVVYYELGGAGRLEDR